MKLINRRRRFLRDALALTGAVALGGCDKLSETDWAPKVLDSATGLSHAAQRALSRNAMAREYTEADISPVFRANGSTDPQSAEYRALAANGFRDYRLGVGGLSRTRCRCRCTICARCRTAPRSPATTAWKAGA